MIRKLQRQDRALDADTAELQSRAQEITTVSTAFGEPPSYRVDPGTLEEKTPHRLSAYYVLGTVPV